MLGVTAGILTGVAVKGLVGEPLVSGGGAVAFYAAFGVSSLMSMFVMLNYLSMSVQLAATELEVRLGMKSGTVPIREIVEVRVAKPQSRMSRAATQTRADRRSISKLWSVLGVKTGVEIDLLHDGSGGDKSVSETWFIASNDPETLSEKIELRIPQREAVEELAASDDADSAT